jgi:hypothetical protein
MRTLLFTQNNPRLMLAPPIRSLKQITVQMDVSHAVVLVHDVLITAAVTGKIDVRPNLTTINP